MSRLCLDILKGIGAVLIAVASMALMCGGGS